MARSMNSSLSTFQVLSLLVLLELELVLLCVAAAKPGCSTFSGEHATIDHPHGQNDTALALKANLLNGKLKKLRCTSGDHHSSGFDALLKGPRVIIGMTAELIRYDHRSKASDTNASELFLEIKRSLARASRIKISKGWKGGRGSPQDSTTHSNVTAEARPSAATGMHTDLSSGAPFEYLMKMSIGTPPQHLVAVADTGSDLVWLQCTPPAASCDTCFPASDDHFFDPSRSQTFSQLTCKSKPCQRLAMQYSDWVSCSSRCEYSYFYADNSSTTGDLAMDTIHMKTSTAFGELVNTAVHDVAFGCGQNQFSTSTLYLAANGVVGLGKGPLSLPSQLGAQFGKKFSYCLVDRKNSRVQSSPILFGDVAVPKSAGLQYTPFLENPEYPTYYYIGLERISVGGETLDIPSRVFDLDFSPGNPGDGGTVIDSGTTYSQLVAPAYTALLQALNSRISYERVAGYFDFCHDVTETAEELIDVPSITLHFRDGAKLKLPFQNAFILVHDDPVPGKTTMCLAINNSTDTGFTIIGNYQQSNFHILYDLQDKRLGFVPRQC